MDEDKEFQPSFDLGDIAESPKETKAPKRKASPRREKRKEGEQGALLASNEQSAAPRKLEVSKHFDEYVQAAQELMKITDKKGDIDQLQDELGQAAYEKIIAPIYGNIQIRVGNNIEYANGGGGLYGQGIQGGNFAFQSDEFSFGEGFVLGRNTMLSAHNPEVYNAFLIGFNIMAGSGFPGDPTRRSLECESPTIDESFICGPYALRRVENALVRNTVVAGFGALEDAKNGITFENTKVVRPEGVYYFKEKAKLVGRINWKALERYIEK